MKNKSQFILIIFVLVALSFPSSGFSAMQEVFGEYCDVYTGDMKNKKKTEVEFINGAIYREGLKAGVATPYNELLYRMVSIMENTYEMQF